VLSLSLTKYGGEIPLLLSSTHHGIRGSWRARKGKEKVRLTYFFEQELYF
jgi:hypothetical protein